MFIVYSDKQTINTKWYARASDNQSVIWNDLDLTSIVCTAVCIPESNWQADSARKIFYSSSIFWSKNGIEQHLFRHLVCLATSTAIVWICICNQADAKTKWKRTEIKHRQLNIENQSNDSGKCLTRTALFRSEGQCQDFLFPTHLVPWWFAKIAAKMQQSGAQHQIFVLLDLPGATYGLFMVIDRCIWKMWNSKSPECIFQFECQTEAQSIKWKNWDHPNSTLAYNLSDAWIHTAANQLYGAGWFYQNSHIWNMWQVFLHRQSVTRPCLLS